MFKRARVTPGGIAVGVIATLVIGSGTAWAANGAALRLGKKNQASKVTTVTSTKGTPLSLKAARNKPPLRVNSSKKVRRLNADQLDGRSASFFAQARGKTGVIARYGSDDNSPGNTYAVAVATCPKGTVLTGGGGFAMLDGDALWYSGPGSRPNTWEADADGDGNPGTGSEVVAYAVCYNPRGSVSGALTFPQLNALKASLRAGR